MTTTRHTVRAAGLVAVAFSLTACQDDGGKDDAGSSSSAGASKDSEGKDSEGKDSGGNDSGSAESGSTGGGGSQSGDEDNGDVGQPTGDADSGVKRSACTVGKVAVSLQETGGSAPVILLKATNNGSARCDLYGYPFVGFPDAQSSIPAGGRKPQSVVSLEPGQSAYAALSLAEGDGGDMHREKQLTIELADQNPQGTGETAKINAPGDASLAISDNSTVTYWNDTIEEVPQ
ncbi:DUF4232 domain-containing protein [Streptomyces sp. NPDC059455]|uniref:DUF4232 domain-containing protein n=1 Tax=Streptomyces sp. NPDC059455 TaxID=3346837 RepID=UPI0036C5BA51